MNCTCINCKKQIDIDLAINWKVYACIHCGSLTVNPNLEKSVAAQYERLRYKNSGKNARRGLFVGNRCEIEGVVYFVIGVIEKKQDEGYKWREYILKSPQDDYRYLSESNGHWVILEEMETYDAVLKATNGIMDIEAKSDRITSYNFYPISVQGFFDFNPLEAGLVVEMAEPPYLYSTELYRNIPNQKDVQIYYFGKHVDRRQVKKWFPDAILRTPTGVGIVQPFAINIKQMAYVFLTTALLLFTLNFLYYYKDLSYRQVFAAKLEFVKGENFSSPSFNLEGRTGTLDFNFYSPVDNNWASCDIALVNELTSEKKYFSKDIEYYSGYEGGEYWNEGKRDQTASVCGVLPGRYHLEFIISRDASVPITNTDSIISSQAGTLISGVNSVSNSYIDAKVFWKKPTIWNLNFVVIGMLVILLIVYGFNRYFEQRRAEYNY